MIRSRSPRLQRAEKTKMSVPAFVVFCVSLAVCAFALVDLAHAAEPETSDPADITRDAVASLEAAKTELLPKQGELEAEEMRIKREIEGTIGDCRQIRAEYIMASGGKIGAEGAVTALEEVSRNNPSVAERISDQLEEARLLVTVHETEMGEAITRADAVEASQNSLLTQREEVERQIREIKSAVATLDAAIRELRPPTRRPVNTIDYGSLYGYGLQGPELYNPYAEREVVDVPQIAACMVAEKSEPSSSAEGRDTTKPLPGLSTRDLRGAEPLLPGRVEGDL